VLQQCDVVNSSMSANCCARNFISRNRLTPSANNFVGFVRFLQEVLTVDPAALLCGHASHQEMAHCSGCMTFHRRHPHESMLINRQF